MLKINVTKVIEFTLWGFQDIEIFSPALFVPFLLIYILTLFGNLLIIALVLKVQTLKSPMYFFLTQLSLCDILLTTNTVPNMLHVLLKRGSKISIAGCLTQYFFYSVSASAESLLLTVMSYDRYLAICRPLHYTSVMDLRLQSHLVFWSWLLPFMVGVLTVLQILNLQFCGPHIIDHYFCDIAPILELSCSDHNNIDLTYFILAIMFALIPFGFIVCTYVFIFSAIFGISSSSGKEKAFSTCSSHLIVVCTYYGTLITIYMVPTKGHSFNVNKVISLLYTLATPFCNPIIYSLRNKQIKKSLMKGFLDVAG
ncbi:olfactory receptor 11A1-like [Spea bombifrons]|uniref:olfactory receptor 11A1-like n=1 Tax=Spea bombifrons TaxID=233779 RepID=UPI0023499429|nr:olfactory receptor 11A1-like [Spea bombifrons]